MINALFLASALLTQGYSPTTQSVYLNAATSGQLSGVALNAAEATRTVSVDTFRSIQGQGSVAAYSKLRLGIAYTYSAATTVTSAMTCSYDGGTTYYKRQSRSCSSGTCNTFDLTDSNAISAASETFELEYDIRGCTHVKFVLGGASADGSDLVTTQTVLIVGE